MNTAQAGMLANLFPLALIFLIFYFILIRPQQKQQKDFKKMLEALKKNDQIVTVGGIHGTIINVKDKTLVVRIDDNTRIEIDKSAIGRLEKAGA
ncbi:preprotein translocase subunit YajC [Candidatus Velamenicoccus archaeovorus]|uniref:Sec translocon accessory complex subunit YajC n=1 Tax=Velamenicoccus archaeovorus TaxID=1930593 RepID=A0A410P4U3_VELA1|nr:preprotein translocase subunit YajC [Candidatus Velamenicoccus archaeovorus]QAT17140.1 preprotein translocase subunit YajC [Candidatus Velamenicoccus archaeovorus]